MRLPSGGRPPRPPEGKDPAAPVRRPPHGSPTDVVPGREGGMATVAPARMLSPACMTGTLGRHESRGPDRVRRALAGAGAAPARGGARVRRGPGGGLRDLPQRLARLARRLALGGTAQGAGPRARRRRGGGRRRGPLLRRRRPRDPALPHGLRPLRALLRRPLQHLQGQRRHRHHLRRRLRPLRARAGGRGQPRAPARGGGLSQRRGPRMPLHDRLARPGPPRPAVPRRVGVRLRGPAASGSRRCRSPPPWEPA